MSETRGHLDAVQQQGLDWIDRMLSGEATTADLEDMRRWRATSVHHADALAQAARVRRALVAAAPAFEPSRLPAMRPQASHATRRALLGGALAASVAGYMAVRPPMDLWPSLSDLLADYRTGAGERQQVALRTGVALDLNTRTSVALRSNGGGKQAELLDGEALATIDVPADRAFVLTAANGRVSAHQASFDVQRSRDGVSVTCISGLTTVVCGGRTATLAGGQRIDYSARGLGPVAIASADIATAWRNGLIIFHDQPLSTVIDSVNRYRASKIMVVDAALGRQRMSGSLHLDHLDDIVAQVRLNGARVTTLPGGVILLG